MSFDVDAPPRSMDDCVVAAKRVVVLGDRRGSIRAEVGVPLSVPTR